MIVWGYQDVCALSETPNPVRLGFPPGGLPSMLTLKPHTWPFKVFLATEVLFLFCWESQGSGGVFVLFHFQVFFFF